MIFNQQEFDIRCEWGAQGVATLAPISDVVIIVDVLSFSTSVDIAINRGAIVFPYRGPDNGAMEYAASVDALLADPSRAHSEYSLSPQSLMQIPSGTRIVLPSPNGSTLSLAAKPAAAMAGCLRNARAVALAASRYGSKIAVIAAGERWKGDGSLRPSFEDLAGAGAIISYLNGSLSPEAFVAAAAFRGAKPRLAVYLRQCASGKELIERGFGEDVDLASELNASTGAPVLIQDAYVRAEN